MGCTSVITECHLKSFLCERTSTLTVKGNSLEYANNRLGHKSRHHRNGRSLQRSRGAMPPLSTPPQRLVVRSWSCSASGSAILVLLCLKRAANTCDYAGYCRLARARQHYLDPTTPR